ncbi:MAG: regulator [Gammaproteobacteria bacterium]|nr:regulator [Gammaproteobacteria bacterium]
MGFIKTRWWGVAVVSVTLFGCSGDDAPPSTPSVATQTPSEVAAESEVTNKDGYRVAASFGVGEDTYVRSMAIDTQSNALWVGTSVGVMAVDLTSTDLRASYTREQGLANEYVFGIHIDQKGDRWFGTNGGGVSKFTTDKQWKTYFPMHGLADYWVYSFAEQSDGTLWVGTWAGLSRFDPEKEIFHTYLDELVNEWVYGLGVDSRDRVWIGTEGGVNMFDGASWSTWKHEDGLGAANDQNLPLSTNTGLGTRSRHDLSVMGGGQLTYNPNYVFSLIVATDDTIWAGTWGGGVAHYDGKSWTNFSSKDGLAGNIVYSVAQDEKGGLWFGTNGGLSYFDGKTWLTFDQSDGLLDNNIYAIAPDADGRIWVGSRSGVAMLAR